MTRLWDVGCGFALALAVIHAAPGSEWYAFLYGAVAGFCWRARTIWGDEFQDARTQFQRARVAMRGKR